MTDENRVTSQEVENPAANPDSDYLETIKNLKENTVSKAEYEKVLADRKRILNDYINKNPNEDVAVVIDSKETIKQLRKELFTDEVENLTNLDYWKKSLAYRQNMIDSGKGDPFLPMKGSTAYDEELSDKVVDVVQECIDGCNDDPAVFNALLAQRTR